MNETLTDEWQLRCAQLQKALLDVERDRDDWKARAEAAERNLAHVRGDWESALRRQRALESELATLRADRAEERANEKAWRDGLRAENERLRVELELAWNDEDETKRANAAESSLVAATELLREMQHAGTTSLPWRQRARAFLANQPAAPTTFAGTPRVGIEERGLGQPSAPARTEHRLDEFETDEEYVKATRTEAYNPHGFCRHEGFSHSNNLSCPREEPTRTEAVVPSWCAKCNAVKPCPGCTIPAAPTRTEAETCETCLDAARFDGIYCQEHNYPCDLAPIRTEAFGQGLAVTLDDCPRCEEFRQQALAEAGHAIAAEDRTEAERRMEKDRNG